MSITVDVLYNADDNTTVIRIPPHDKPVEIALPRDHVAGIMIREVEDERRRHYWGSQGNAANYSGRISSSSIPATGCYHNLRRIE